MAGRKGTVGSFSDKRPAELLNAEGIPYNREPKYTPEKVFLRFRDVSLIWHNRELIWHDLFNGPNSTIKSRLPRLTVAGNFFRKLQDTGLKIDGPNDLDLAITTSFLQFVEGEKQAALKTEFFRALLLSVGTKSEHLPYNPFKRTTSGEAVLYTDERTRKAVNVLKGEFELLLRRVKTRDSLLMTGKDPRPEYGGEDDWEKPQNGLFIATKIVGLSLSSWDEMNAAKDIPDFRKIMRGLCRCPGAPYMGYDGIEGVGTGWSGQVRWFHPYADDVAPLVVLTMIRTGVNFSAIARTKAGRINWSEPYPFNVGGNAADEYVFMLFDKVRAVSGDTGGPNVKIVSSTRPYSHPYRVFQFVEELTAPLRRDILNEIRRLQQLINRTEKETARLLRLDLIKDDLFIYRTHSGFGSLSEYAERETPEAIRKCLVRCGLETNIRHLRSLKLNFAYSHSANNLFVAQILAQHRSSETSLLYIRRKATIQRHYEMFENIFAMSVPLIKKGSLSYDALRTMLEAQGFLGGTLDNLMNPDFRTRWGNACATPFAPPPGFDHGTQAGDMCRNQNCIDGCPSARWFYDVEAIVEKQHAALCARRNEIGLMSIEGSSLPSQIERCEKMLAAWKAAA